MFPVAEFIRQELQRRIRGQWIGGQCLPEIF